jgi:hypothetical protein
MKKIIAFVAFAAALAVFASFPQPGVSHQAAAEPTEMLATMPAPQSLKTESYDAI